MHCMHVINAILNYKNCNLNYRGDFRMGETLYRGPEILFRWGRLCFVTESPEGRFHISQGETLFWGRLYFVTPARDESSCGPRCPIRKVTILGPDIQFTVAQFEFHQNSIMKSTDDHLQPDISTLIVEMHQQHASH